MILRMTYHNHNSLFEHLLYILSLNAYRSLNKIFLYSLKISSGLSNETFYHTPLVNSSTYGCEVKRDSRVGVGVGNANRYRIRGKGI